MKDRQIARQEIIKFVKNLEKKIGETINISSYVQPTYIQEVGLDYISCEVTSKIGNYIFCINDIYEDNKEFYSDRDTNLLIFLDSLEKLGKNIENQNLLKIYSEEFAMSLTRVMNYSFLYLYPILKRIILNKERTISPGIYEQFN